MPPRGPFSHVPPLPRCLGNGGVVSLSLSWWQRKQQRGLPLPWGCAAPPSPPQNLLCLPSWSWGELLDFPWDGVWWGQGEVSDTGQGSWFSSSSLSLPSPCAGSLRYAGITPGRARATQTMRAGEYPRFLRVLLLVRAGSFPLGRIHLPPYPRGQDERAPLCHVPFSLKSPPMLQKEPFWRWSSCSSLGGCSSSLPWGFGQQPGLSLPGVSLSGSMS